MIEAMVYRASTPAQHHILTTASAPATAYAEKDFITAPGPDCRSVPFRQATLSSTLPDVRLRRR